MEHYESRLMVNNEWRTVLIVKSTEEQTFGKTLRFEHSGFVEIYTIGSAFRTIEEEGYYYYWFLPESHEFICAQDSEARDKLSSVWDQLAEAYNEGVQQA